jgi:hypothetical protein
VDLPKERGGFNIEVKGSGRAEMALFWEPFQWEGSLELSGRISAGYRRFSIGLSLGGSARARVRLRRALPGHLLHEMNKIGTSIFACYHKIFGGNITNQLLPSKFARQTHFQILCYQKCYHFCFFYPKMPSKFVTILPKLNSKSGERTSPIVVSGLGGI